MGNEQLWQQTSYGAAIILFCRANSEFAGILIIR